MKKKLNAYKGKLTPAQIAEGINAAKRNAKRLLDDAKLLLEAKRYPSAASLSVLSIEENGKVAILRSIAVAKNDKETGDWWKDYRSHTRKNLAWLLPQLFAQGARRLDDFKPLFDKKSDHPYILDQLKQIGFYTDCLGNAHWSIPEEVIDEQLAKALFTIASIFGKDTETTPKEIELWVKHIGPVWRGNHAWMKKALVNWYTEMQQLGLVPEGDNEMKKFIYTGISGD